VIPAFEDVWHYLWAERRLPVNVDPLQSELRNEDDRARLARVFERGLDQVVGYALPLRRQAAGDSGPRWSSGPWFLRTEHMFLVPGDSPIGYRLPLDSLPWVSEDEYPHVYDVDPFAPRPPLPSAQRYVRPDATYRPSMGPAVPVRPGRGESAPEVVR